MVTQYGDSIWWSNRGFFSQFQQKVIFISLHENFHCLSTAKINPAKSLIFCQIAKISLPQNVGNLAYQSQKLISQKLIPQKLSE